MIESCSGYVPPATSIVAVVGATEIAWSIVAQGLADSRQVLAPSCAAAAAVDV